MQRRDPIGIKDKWNDADIHIRRFMERKFNLHLLLIVNSTIIGIILLIGNISAGAINRLMEFIRLWMIDKFQCQFQ